MEIRRDTISSWLLSTLVTTIRVVRGTDSFTAEGLVLKVMSVSEMGARREPKLIGIVIGAVGMEVHEAVGSKRGSSQERAKGEGFRLNARENVKRMGRDDVRERRDYCDAVPGIGGFKEGLGIGRGGGRKSRGRFRT
jgi:hypothetical protein